MGDLKYKVIKSKKQYKAYCDVIEELAFSGSRNKETKDEIDLLTVLIERWEEDHDVLDGIDPIKLLASLMEEHDMKAKDLTAILEVSKGYVSDILNYKKGLSKEVIRKLATYFKVKQEMFNRPYELEKGVSK